MDLEFVNSQANGELLRPLANYGKKQCRYNFLEQLRGFSCVSSRGISRLTVHALSTVQDNACSSRGMNFPKFMNRLSLFTNRPGDL
jgi:hypothetical protein